MVAIKCVRSTSQPLAKVEIKSFMESDWLYLDDYIYIPLFQAKATDATEIKASVSILSRATWRKQSLVHAAWHKITNLHISVFTFFLKAGINHRTWLKLFLVHGSLWNLLYFSHNSTIYHFDPPHSSSTAAPLISSASCHRAKAGWRPGHVAGSSHWKTNNNHSDTRTHLF